MKTTTNWLAVDLGAESVRAMLGRFDGESIALEAVHRFENRPVMMPSGLHWNALALFRGTCAAIAEALRCGYVESVGVDGWAVDFGLLDRDGELLGSPSHYRDERTCGMLERAFERVPREEIYALTGIQFMRFNTLYQLLAREGSAQLEAAETLLLVPDLLGYWLTGEIGAEETNASTTQLFDISARQWAWSLIERLGLPARLFPALRHPGTALAPLHPRVAEEIGAPRSLSLIAVASHDTASAVVAVPAETDNFAYISSGTWSLVGLELDAPELGEAAFRHNIANELGFGGRIRFLKNVMGLWLLQQCRRAWAREGRTYDYGELAGLAAEAPAFGALIDPDRPEFDSAGDIPSRIRQACTEGGQRPPETDAAIARCVFESLACKYRLVVERLEEIRGGRVDVVHIVGGGSRNPLLCQLTADLTGRPVVAGPGEATALGNMLVQAFAHGRLRSLAEMRDVARCSSERTVYSPERGEAARWDTRYGDFLEMVSIGDASGCAADQLVQG